MTTHSLILIPEQETKKALDDARAPILRDSPGPIPADDLWAHVGPHLEILRSDYDPTFVNIQTHLELLLAPSDVVQVHANTPAVWTEDFGYGIWLSAGRGATLIGDALGIAQDAIEVIDAGTGKAVEPYDIVEGTYTPLETRYLAHHGHPQKQITSTGWRLLVLETPKGQRPQDWAKTYHVPRTMTFNQIALVSWEPTPTIQWTIDLPLADPLG